MSDIDARLTQLEKKLSEEIRHLDTKTIECFKGLADKIGEQTEGMAKFVTSVEHLIESSKDFKALGAQHTSDIGELRAEVAVLKAGQGGHARLIEKLGYPLILAALFTYFTIKGG